MVWLVRSGVPSAAELRGEPRSLCPLISIIEAANGPMEGWTAALRGA